MKKQHLFLSVVLVTLVLSMVFNSCKDDEKTTLALSALVAGTIDLNGATAPSNVPANAVITATFTTDIDPTSVSNTSVALIRDYDKVGIELTLTVTGAAISITPKEKLGNGTLYKLTVSTAVKSKDGQAMVSVDRSFTTEGTFAPAGAVAHWNFENNAKDQVGTYNSSAEVAITYTDSRNAAAGKAATFDGTTSIIEIPNGDKLMNTNDFTLSFWVKALNSGKGHFVIGLAAFYGFQFEMSGDFKNFKMPVQFDYGDGTSGTGGDLAYSGDGKTKDNGGWKGTTVNKENKALNEVLKEKWAHIAYVYNSATKERMMFLNGELVVKQDHNLWTDDKGVKTKEAGIVGLKYAGVAPETVNELAFGFIQSRAGTLWATEDWGGYTKPGANHFKGQLDDVRFFNKAITATEILLMYNSEKP